MTAIAFYLSRKKHLLLSFIFFFIIGIYWFLRPIKDGVFISMLGAEYLPYAKIISVIVVFPFLALYGKLVDKLSRERVFYAMSALFAVGAFIFYVLLKHPFIGWYAQEHSIAQIVVGIALSIYVKMFGSVMVAVFWSFVADISTPEEANESYPIISTGGQIGNVVGPLFVGMFASKLGVPFLIGLAASLMSLLIGLMAVFMMVVPTTALRGYQGHYKDAQKHERLGFLAGFKFIFSQPYLLSIYATISLFEVIQALFDYRFKIAAGTLMQGDQLVAFLGKFGAMTGVVAIICLLGMTRRITHTLGLTSALMTVPLILFVLSFFNFFNHIYLAMIVLIVTRAINYALNQPSKEQLYIPTSKEAKYKAKAWIEIVGTRTSEGFAQLANLSHHILGPYFVSATTILSLFLSCGWVFLARFQGRKHKKAVHEKTFIC